MKVVFAIEKNKSESILCSTMVGKTEKASEKGVKFFGRQVHLTADTQMDFYMHNVPPNDRADLNERQHGQS